MEPFWYDDIWVLLDPVKIKKYIPLKQYTKNEKLNSIVRLSIYISLLFVILTGNNNYIFVSIFFLILTLLINSLETEKIEKNNSKKVENYKNIKDDKDFKEQNIKVDEILEDCILPTDDNPFMNILLTDKRNRKSACQNKKIKKLIDNKFSKGLFKNINSIYDRENSQREFYTMPSTTIPNRQNELGEWLYKTPKTCKEGNINQCMANNMEKLNGESYQFV
tara:strand:- start:1554 stop:2216 length:663 start_codon:yes stop_codon:yes gene_type:complete